MHEALDAQFVEKRLHLLAHFEHELEIGEEDEGLAVGHADEMFDPMDEAGLVAGVARVGHFAGDEDLHLPLVIEGRAGLDEFGLLAADLAGEVVQGRRRGRAGFGNLGLIGRNGHGQSRAGHDDGGVRPKESLRAG